MLIKLQGRKYAECRDQLLVIYKELHPHTSVLVNPKLEGSFHLGKSIKYVIVLFVNINVDALQTCLRYDACQKTSE